jgi:hypothetical protein
MPAVQPARRDIIHRLVAQLDSDDFEARRKAKVELENLGDLAVPTLRDLLPKQGSVEVSKAIQDCLEKANSLSPKQLHVLRAIMVLELLGTEEAKVLLTILSGGAKESRITQEAQAALRRLKSQLFRPVPTENAIRPMQGVFSCDNGISGRSQ